MKSLGILALAASASLPASALAQTVTPPPEEDTPPAALRTPAPKATPAPGVSWQGTAPAPRAAPPIARPAPPAPVAVAPAPPAPPARVVIVRTPPSAAPLPPPPARVVVRSAPPAVAPLPPVAMHHPPIGPEVVERVGPHRERVVIHRRATDHPRPRYGGPGPIMERALPPEAWGEVVEETVTVDADGREHRSVIRRPVAPHELAEGGILAPYANMYRAPRAPGYGMDPRVHAYGGYGYHHPMRGSRWSRQWREGRRGGIPEYVGDGDYRPSDEDYARVSRYPGYPGYYYAQPQPGPVVVETIVTTTGTVEERP